MNDVQLFIEHRFIYDETKVSKGVSNGKLKPKQHFVGDETTLCVINKTCIFSQQDARLTYKRCAS